MMKELPRADASVVPSNLRVLAAVSSGADSMALLAWLLSLGRDVIVGHVNHDLHELRNGDCQRDEDFVRDRCAQSGIAFRTKTVELLRRSGHVNENVAREARYLALAEMARENGCSLVATAHTATDGLETALLNLMRGAGPQGFSGIAPTRPLNSEISLVRPFWNVAREATREFLRQNGWNWREDASNLDPLFRRNRVRNEILPLLGEISGQNTDDLAVRFAANAQVTRDEADWVAKCARETLESLILRHSNDLLILDGRKFAELETALARRVLRLAIQTLAPDFRDLAREKIEETRICVVSGGKRAVWTWRGDLRVEWTGAGAGNRLRFWRVKPLQ
ncbi:MAG TPA: tRNA lysidine(34) synthetase TilS [Abditibacterium sp.]|jgi:tRNA(Ile)-lysidine synthase